MAVAFYVTHPEVVIDPVIPVPDWRLNEVGRTRVGLLAARMPQVPYHIVTSAERKALETAWPLGARVGRAVEVRPAMHENDRSATGYLPGPEFEAVADAFFGEPEVSVRGWERAVDAQARILAEVEAVLAYAEHDVIFVGHGAVGTLLYCALAGKPVDRIWDQAKGGNWFAFNRFTRRPLDHWAPIETLFA